jgi:hypothetical protein
MNMGSVVWTSGGAGTGGICGRLAEAVDMEVSVLTAHQQVLGKVYPNSLLNMANLALTYSRQGQLGGRGWSRCR